MERSRPCPQTLKRISPTNDTASNMRTTALVDADFLVYAIGFGKENYYEEEAIAALDETVYRILDEVNADYNLFYLSSTAHGFRSDLYPAYKANRTGKPKPLHYEALRNHLINIWCAEVSSCIEADDECSLNCINTDEHKTILVHVDKDLNQIVGTHFNPKRWEWYEVSGWMSRYFFYTQMLTGDRVDNIPPVKKGMGPKTAEKLLEGCTTEEELYTVVRAAFNDDKGLALQAELLWLLSNERTNLILERHGRKSEGKILGQDQPPPTPYALLNNGRPEALAEAYSHFD